MKKSEIAFGVARIPIDCGMTLLAFLVAYQIRQYGDLIPGLYFPIDKLNFPPLWEYLRLAIISTFGLVGLFAIDKMYSLKNTTRIGSELIQVAILASTWIMLIIAYYFVTRQFFFSRLVLGYIWIATIVLISLGRIGVRLLQLYLFQQGIGQRRIVLLGNNAITERIYKKLKTLPSYQIIGVLSSGSTDKKIESLPMLGTFENLKEITQSHHVEELIQTESNLSESQVQEIIDFCREHHLTYHFVPGVLQMLRTHVDTLSVAELPLISLKTTPLDGWGKVMKRAFDLAISGLLLIGLMPLLLVIALGIKLDSKGPVLFSRKDDGSCVKRVGQYGRLFKFYKFRTMVEKTDNLRYTALFTQNHRKNSPLVKIKNDPRVTRFGHFLRRWSLDELPQLWNVLLGDISLVGPRAHLPEEVAHYKNHQKFLLTIKPGITGLSQVSGRSDLDFEEEVRLDTHYIENWSLLLDLKILMRTIFVVLEGKGAD